MMAPMLRAAVVLAGLLVSSARVPAQAIEWWQKDLPGALAAAKDKPAGLVLLYCWQDDGPCRDMFQGTLSEAEVGAALAEFVCMGAKDDDAGKALWQQYGVGTKPTVLFLDPAGAVVDVAVGYVPAKEFLGEVQRIRAGTDTIPALRAKVAAAPDDHATALALVRKLRVAGDKPGAASVIDAMLAKDPKFTSEIAAEAMLARLSDQLAKPGGEPKDADLKPLRDFLGKMRHKRVLFLGWDRVAATEFRRGNLKAAAEAAEKAWKHIPPDEVLPWGQRIAGRAYENWQALDKIDKDLLKRALEVSKKALEVVEKRHQASPDNVFYANALYLHAAVQIVNNQRKEAFASMDKAMALDPSNENLKKARDRWLDGSK
jgi:tetratricopeptide (TPR) repeat protein